MKLDEDRGCRRATPGGANSARLARNKEISMRTLFALLAASCLVLCSGASFAKSSHRAKSTHSKHSSKHSKKSSDSTVTKAEKTLIKQLTADIKADKLKEKADKSNAKAEAKDKSNLKKDEKLLTQLKRDVKAPRTTHARTSHAATHAKHARRG
jgi:hypothetical protein